MKAIIKLLSRWTTRPAGAIPVVWIEHAPRSAAPVRRPAAGPVDIIEYEATRG